MVEYLKFLISFSINKFGRCVIQQSQACSTEVGLVLRAQTVSIMTLEAMIHGHKLFYLHSLTRLLFLESEPGVVEDMNHHSVDF